jgi:membrane-anchored protein YejM (alkaline phosphatase superfamily)
MNKNSERYFIAINTILGFLASCLLLTTTPPKSLFELTFYSLSLLAQIGLLFYIIHLPIRFLPERYRAWLNPLLFSILILLIVVDSQIYSFFRFHINLMVWNVITTEGGWSTLGISSLEIGIYFLLSALFTFIQYKLFYFLQKKSLRPFPLRSHIVGLIILQITSTLVYAYGDLYDDSSITKVYHIVPYYQPLTVKRSYYRIYGHLPTPQIDINIKLSGDLKYPLKPIDWQEPQQKYNFIFLIIDCFRQQSFDANITPNLWRFSKDSQTFTNHYSGGNATRNGVFSILYGVYSTYWDHFLRQNQSPLFIDRLQQLEYNTQVYASTLQSFPEFRKTAFVNMNDKIKDDFPGEIYQKDQQVLDSVEKYIGQNKDKNFFTYSLLDAAHSTYSFPATATYYKPIITNVTYSLLTDEQKRIHMKNRYHNALRHLDERLGIFLDSLKSSGVLKNTIIVITGDHGDEFMEYGNIGHSNAFTPQQIMSPLIMYIPNKAGQTFTHKTNHNDIMATLIPMLGAKNPVSDFSHGINLFDITTSKDTLACSWDNCALVDDLGYMIFGTKSYNSHKVEFRNKKYEIVSKSEGLTPERMKASTQILLKMSELLK